MEPLTFLENGGELGALIARRDWSATPLGPIAAWSMSLRNAVAFVVHSPAPLVMLWGDAGTMIYNDGYAKFAADNHPDILGRPVREAWPEVAEFNDHVMKVGLGGGSLAYQDHHLKLNRTGQFEDVWLNLDYSPVFGDDGRPAGVLAIVVETTKLVAAGKALEESEARLHFLDRLGRATSAALEAQDVLEVTAGMLSEELGLSFCAYGDLDVHGSGFTLRKAWPGADTPGQTDHYSLDSFGELAARRLRKGEGLVINDSLSELPPAATAAFAAVGARALIWVPLVKEGRLAALMAAHRDQPHIWTEREIALTREVAERSWSHAERTQTEAALAVAASRLGELSDTLEERVEERSAALNRSQTQFRLLVQGVTDYAIYMLDEHGNVISWNAGAERIKGYRPDEIIGQHFSSFYSDEDRARGEPDRALETARREGRFNAEGWRVRKDGSRFRASVVIDAIHDDDGRLIGFAKITRDVTEREEAQQELEMAREALFQSQKMESIGQLTGGVAHDFNNLLMAIRSSLELLRKRVPDEPQIRKLLDNSMKATDRGASLTQRMLAFARRQELATEEVMLPALIRGMKELLERALGPAYSIDTRLPSNLPAVSTDVNQLEMALLNLAVNARDSMPHGGDILIRAEAMTASADQVPDLVAGRYVRMTVSDSGSGMDAETLAKAIEPFFTTKGVGKGTGLGLSMVDGFAKQLGGTLEIESELGAGTKAHMWLPVREKVAGEAAPAESLEPALGTSRKILVVDDDAIILMNTGALLEDLGHRVIEAGSGLEALTLFAAHDDVEMLVTDQAMPGMTGSDLIAAVRALRPHLPIVLATGYGETPHEAGQTVVRLGKPFSQTDLERAVADAIAGVDG